MRIMRFYRCRNSICAHTFQDSRYRSMYLLIRGLVLNHIERIDFPLLAAHFESYAARFYSTWVCHLTTFLANPSVKPRTSLGAEQSPKP